MVPANPGPDAIPNDGASNLSANKQSDKHSNGITDAIPNDSNTNDIADVIAHNFADTGAQPMRQDLKAIF